MNRRWVIALALGSTLILLTGCYDFVGRDQPYGSLEEGVILEAGHPVGQTFVARYSGLDGIEVFLRLRREGRGEIRLHLRADPQATEDLATSALPLSQIAAPGFYHFSFEPLPDSHQRYYYAFLEAIEEEQGTVQVGKGPAQTYPDGALYRDHEPLNAQMAFRASYNPCYMLLDLGREAVWWLEIMVMAGLLYVVPGWALLVWLWPGRQLSWIERLSFAVGLSLALYPVLLLWTDLAGLHMGFFYAWLPAIGGVIALLCRYRPWQFQLQALRGAWREWVLSEQFWPDLTLALVAGLALALRLLMVRNLDVPIGADSYQHTVIARLIAEHGGLFESWEPYAPLLTFTYHFGFHVHVAVFHWLTGMEVIQAVIWVGQIFNWMAVLVLAPLAVRVSGNRWAGAVAVLLAGLLSPMPAYYVNWGRYTQLAGQIILLPAILLTWKVLEEERRDLRLIALTWIAAGGLALTHYRIMIFYIIFVVVWVLIFLRREVWQQTFIRAAWVGMGAVLLFFPWFVHTLAGEIILNLRRVSAASQQINAIGELSLYLSPVWWLTLPVAVGLGLWQRRREVLFVALWWFLLFIAVNPEQLHLPGTGVIHNFDFFIAIYIPAGVLIGYLGVYLVSQLARWQWSWPVLTLLLVGAGLSRVWLKASMVDLAQHALVTRPDLQAMAWIRENTPQEAQFLVNFLAGYGGEASLGTDGGLWIPLLAGRKSAIPPLNYAAEQGMRPDYRQWVNELAQWVPQMDIDDPKVLARLQERGVTHIYIGQQQGQVYYCGGGVLDPEALLRSFHSRLVYHQDRVWIFEVVP